MELKNDISRLIGKIDFSKWVQIGVLTELIILVYSLLSYSDNGDIYRHAARYSGRVSLIIYLFSFYYFALNFHELTDNIFEKLRKIVLLFFIIHFIHFGFLTLSFVYSNNVHLVPFKLLGGFFAYLMILFYPWTINKFKTNKLIHLVYFYYIGIVMAFTYVARLKGGYDGKSSPETFHFVGITLIIFSFLTFTSLIITKKKTYADKLN